jgi:tRNA A-37 threonylcarbamoyl transferase component Bud32
MSEPTTPPPLLSPSSESDAPSGFGAGWTERKTVELEEDNLIGTVVNDTYNIVRIIGEGGMGRVYEAGHTRISKKRYAIKVLHAEFARNEGILKRFQREAETAACLSHPNAVGVYDVGVTSDSRPFLVSEFLEGSDLAHRIKQDAPLSTGFVRHVGLQIAGALVEAHSRGVVHRDLKPQNIFLLAGSDGEKAEQPIAKVLDFGLSRFLDDSDSELTRSGMVMGTPSYMSPEQARGERADHRVDIYGLGAILYACVVGKPPFKCSSPQATVLAVMNEEAPRPSKLNPAVAPELELIIQTAMARDPNRRYATMADFRRELETLADEGHGAVRLRRDSIVRRAEMAPLRIQLLVYWLGGATFLFGSAAAALCGAISLRYGAWPLSSAASGLLAMVVLAAFSAPVLSLFRSVRYRLWDNTALVSEALDATRRVTLAGALGYAGTAGALLLLNIVGVLFSRFDAIRDTALGTFSGIALVAFVAQVLCALAAGFSEYLLSPGGWVDRAESVEQGRRRRLVSGPIVVCGALSLVSSSVVAARHWPITTIGVAEDDGGFVVHESASGAVPIASELDVAPTASVTSSAVMASSRDVDSADRAFASSPALPPDAGAHEPESEDLGEASSDALTAAISQGSDALAELAERYPNDPHVLRALAMDHASRASGLERAIDGFKRLFAVSPQAIYDNDLQQIILAVARSRGTAMHKAFELMAYHMAHVGPDLLYKLSLSDRDRRPQARAYLGRPKVREKFSPALDIAYELQFAPSCTNRLAMLPRAAQFGDERALIILASLAAENKTGCGRRKQQPCRAKCPDEAAQFEQTVRSIAERMQRAAAPAPSASP